MKTIKLIICFSLLAFIAVSCTSSLPTQEQSDINSIQTAAVETAIASMTQTALAIPPTNTPIPYAQLDLSPYLALSSDLPTGYSGGQLRYSPFEMFQELPTTEYIIAEDFQQNGERVGGVNVLVFSSPEIAQQAFDKIQSGFGKDGQVAVTKDGTIKMGVVLVKLGIQAVDMQVMRCNVIYFARFTNTLDTTSVAQYLSAVNQRTKDIIYCPKETFYTTPVPATTTPTSLSQEPLVLSGSGDSIVDVNWAEVPGIMIVEGNASGQYFGITPYKNDGTKLSSIVNKTDPYKGVCPFNFNDEFVSRFEIEAVGNWTIQIVPILQVETVAVPGTIQGTGDNVIALTGAIPDLATITGNAGNEYFGIIPYNANTERMESLVNTIDHYQGTVIVEKDTAYLVIEAVGDWSITINEIKQQ